MAAPDIVRVQADAAQQGARVSPQLLDEIGIKPQDLGVNDLEFGIRRRRFRLVHSPPFL